MNTRILRLATAASTSGLLLAITVALLALPARAQNSPGVYAIKNAKVFTLAGPAVENATVIIRDGKIAAVGVNVDVPAGAQVVDAKGLEVYPGLFDPITQVGLNEVSAVAATVDVTELGEYNPDVVAATAVNPASAHIPVTRASGITHVLAAPGTSGFDSQGGGVITGQASAFNLAGWTMDEMQIKRSAAMVINWPTLETRSFDFSTFSIQEKPYADVKKEYDKKIDEISDWLDRARHYAQAQGERFTRKFRARFEAGGARARRGREVAGPGDRSEGARHPHRRRVLHEAELENDSR